MADGYIFTGNLPIRTELTILPADNPVFVQSKIVCNKLHKLVINARGKCGIRKPRGIGFTVRETIGVAIVNPRGLKAAQKSVVIGK